MRPLPAAFLHPSMPAFTAREILRAAAGAGLGISLAGLLCWGMSFAFPGALRLFAPLGASAVLIFAVPNAPLSQPLSSIGGNTVSMLAVLLLGLVLPGAVLPYLAVPAALALMMALRVLHPPGGAMALLLGLEIAEGAPGLTALVSAPLLTLLLVLAGIGWNRMTGRQYPFRMGAAPGKEADLPADALPSDPGLAPEELEAILRRFNQSTNLGAADLGRMLAAAEEEIWHHRFDERKCAAIMTSPAASLAPDTPLPAILEAFSARGVKAMPVVDGAGQVLGVLDGGQVLTALAGEASAGPRWSFRRVGLRGVGSRGTPAPQASGLMSRSFQSVAPDTPVGQLLRDLARSETQLVVVIEAGRLAGVISRSDVLQLMLEPLSASRAAKAAPKTVPAN